MSEQSTPFTISLPVLEGVLQSTNSPVLAKIKETSVRLQQIAATGNPAERLRASAALAAVRELLALIEMARR
jgi:hypothetical protein